MPETKEARRKKNFETHRTMRIQELARLWGVPTRDVFSQVNWGYGPYEQGGEIPNTVTYFNFKDGNIQYQKIDRAPVRGWPAGVYSPVSNPQSVPIRADSATMGTRPGIISEATGTVPVPLPSAPRRKAQYGDILPLRNRRRISADLENTPAAPFSIINHRVSDFFADPKNRRMIPAVASLDGPDPDQMQYLIDPDTGKVNADSTRGPAWPVDSPHSNPGNRNWQMNFNTAPLITGLAAGINALYDRSAGLKEFNRLKRKQLQGPGYHPFQYGTGSQAIFKWGGKLPPTGSVERLSENPASAPVIQFNGPAHDQGGIPLAYNGQQVEVEGGETGYVDKAGALNIFGNLLVPGTRRKFKEMAKMIATEEARSSRRLQKAGELVSNSDPQDHFDQLRINSGKLLGKVATQEMDTLTMLKERLSALQERELQRLPQDDPHTAQDGKKIRKPSMAERHNNPGNIKYAPWLKKYGATKGERARDGGNFAVFPDKESGLKAMKNLLTSPSYKARTVEDAIKRWTNSEGYKLDLGDLKGRTIADLDDAGLKALMDKITQGEDSKLYDLDFLFTERPIAPTIDASINPRRLPPAPIPYRRELPGVPGTYNNEGVPGIHPPGLTTSPIPELPDMTVPPDQVKPPVSNPVAFSQIAPEMLALMDRPEFVPGQRYEPALYQPYQVSFQDRLNENQATFSRLAMQSGHHPAALSVLAGQKYMADAGVLADEFRTNQGITNDITNKNIGLLNDAQLKNLALADTQFVRQQQAKYNTEQNIFNAVSSVASKYAQNRLETRGYNAISSLFPQYEFDQVGSLHYLPNDGMVFGNSRSGVGTDFYQRSRSEYDGSGQLKKRVLNDPSGAERTKLDFQIWNNRLKQLNAPLGTIKRSPRFTS